ncbi:MAG: regulatory protein RecX, partial [Candidatus Atribacteria bacterium]|nr:regulatory protein RecX [Candidatus Atribacteria bacterium]
MNKITSIEYNKKNAAGRIGVSPFLVYIDNKSRYNLDETIINSLELYVGKELSNHEIKKIVLEDEIIKGKKYTLWLLTRRIYSKYEILKKLKIKGFSENIIPDIVLWLENKEYINDELFATIWSQSRLKNKPVGRYRLNYELKLKGIDQEIIQKVLDKTYNDIDELTLA